MKFSLRPTSASDLTALSQFLVRVFGAAPDAPFVQPAMMAWKYWDRRDDWTEPRSYVLEQEGVIVAHAGLWPMTFGPITSREGTKPVRGAQMIDWASAREAPGAGLALCQRLSAMFDFIYSIGGSEMTQKVLPAFGFKEYGQQWRAACPLRPMRQILTHQYRNWKLAPRFARNWLWSIQGNSPHPKWEAKEISPEQILPEAHSSIPESAVFSPRPPAFLEYLLRCPVARFRLYGIFDGGEPKGHFTIALVRGQARIARVWLRQPDQDAWAAVYYLARRFAERDKETCEVVVAGSGQTSSEGATQAGFHRMGAPAVYLLNKTKNLRLSPGFQFQLSDDDEAFLDTGSRSYWT
jgi:hypothetical protein